MVPGLQENADAVAGNPRIHWELIVPGVEATDADTQGAPGSGRVRSSEIPVRECNHGT